MVIVPLAEWDKHNHVLAELKRTPRLLATAVGELELRFLEDPPAIIVAAHGAIGDAELKIYLNRTMLLLVWLCGVGKLTGFTIETLKSEEGRNRVVWKQGMHEIGQTAWRPVPLGYSDWRIAAGALRQGGEHRTWLRDTFSAQFIAAALDRLVADRRLVYAIEYAALAAQLPVDASGVVLQIAIETLKPKQRTSTKIVDDSAVWKKLEGALKREIQSTVQAELRCMSEGERDSVIRALSNKVEHLNRKSNPTQMLATFESAGVELSELETRMIKRRDPYIHDGGLLVREVDVTQDAFREHHVKEHALLTAVHKLILKQLGYHGPFMDWGKYDQVKRNEAKFQVGELTHEPTSEGEGPNELD